MTQLVDWHNYGKDVESNIGNSTAAFQSEYLAEIIRWVLGTGVVGVRQYSANNAFERGARSFDAAFGAVNLHDHSNNQSMPGLGELAIVANGYYYRSRHNDYRMRKSIIADDETFGYESLHAPEIKASVLAMPTGVSGDSVDLSTGTQAGYFKNIYTDNPEDCEMHLAYAEIWIQNYDGSIEDAGDSFRHSDDSDDVLENFKRVLSYNSEGLKGTFENQPFSASRIGDVGDDSSQKASYINFRIMTSSIGTLADLGTVVQAPLISIAVSASHNHVLSAQMTDKQAQDLVSGAVSSVELTSDDNEHIHVYIISWDGSNFIGVDTHGAHQHEVLIQSNYEGNLPFDADKATYGIVDSENRFSMVHEHSEYSGGSHDIANSRWPRFDCADLARIIEQVPGMDGEGAFIEKQHLIDVDQDYNDRDGGELNAAYYHRTYARSIGAAGRTFEDAGFNDSNLFVANTTKAAVANGVSYLIPLEIIIRSPVENWNPYNIALEERDTIDAGATDGTQTSPYPAFAVDNYYYRIPYAFYADSNPNSDPADTAGAKWLVSGVDGQPRLCWGSGIKPFTADGSQRIRIPVYPLSQDFSHEGARVARLEKVAGYRVISGSGVTYNTAAVLDLLPNAGDIEEGIRYKITDLTLPVGIIDGSISDIGGKSTTRYYTNKPVTGGSLEWVEVYS